MHSVIVVAAALGSFGLARPSERLASSRAPARSRVRMAGPIRAVEVCTSDVDKLASFYEACFGMSRKADSADLKCAEVGYEGDDVCLKVVERDSFRIGEGLGAIAVYADDIDQVAGRVEVRGGMVLAAPQKCTVGPSKIPDEPKGTVHETYEALVADPEGYRFRLIQRAGSPGKIVKVVLCVTNLEHSTEFYSELLGMRVLRWRSNLSSDPMSTSLTVQLGEVGAIAEGVVLEAAPDDAPKSALLELQYPFNTRKIDVGDGGAGRLTIAAAEAGSKAQRAPSAYGELIDGPGASGDTRLRDPDGYELLLVEA